MVRSTDAPMLFVCRIRNEVLELPSPNNAVTSKYLQYGFGNCPRLTSILDFAATGTGRSWTSKIMKKAEQTGNDRQVKNRSDVEMERDEKKNGQQRSEESA